MREMKDSRQAWLGAIPADWTISTIGSLYSLRNEKVSDRDYPPLSVTMKGVVPQLETAAKTDAHDDRKLVKKGDFAINSRSDRRGSCGISDYDGSVSLINTILTPREEMNPRYFNWVFHTSQFADEFYRWGHGIVDDLWTTRWQEMKNISVAVPPLSEQEAIAESLENEVAQIDALIANQQAQIEKLKQYKQSLITEVVTKGLDPNAPMKDSGVEWIGSIPNHWQLIRFRFIANITTGNRDTQDANPDGIYPFYVRSPIVERSDKYTFDGEGILMAGDGAGAGRVFHLVDGKYAVHQRVYRFYDIKYMDKELLKYYLETLFSTVMDYGSAKTTVPSVRLPMIQDFPVCVPPMAEQARLIKYIKDHTATIERSIRVLEQKAAKLNDYKKALIYEYVAGKKEVN